MTTSLVPELQQVVTSYALALDELDLAGLAAILTQDTSWTFTMPEQGPPRAVTGRREVLDFVTAGHAAQTGRVRHHLANIVVRSVEVDTAVVRASLMQTRNTGNGPQLISTGAYTFSLRRVGQVWLIAELALDLDNSL